MEDDSLIYKEMADLRHRGSEIYKHLLPHISRAKYGKTICIDIQSGEHIIEEDRMEAYRIFDEQFGDNYSWELRIGDSLKGANKIVRPLSSKR